MDQLSIQKIKVRMVNYKSKGLFWCIEKRGDEGAEGRRKLDERAWERAETSFDTKKKQLKWLTLKSIQLRWNTLRN